MLIADWRDAWRLWSVQLAAAGAALTMMLLADPQLLREGLAALPPELRALLPAAIERWVVFAIFALTIAGRVAKQAPAAVPPASLPQTLLTSGEPAWRAAARAACTRSIDAIVIHCSATRAGQFVDAAEIRRWHRARGFTDIGYHFVIRLDGTIEVGRPIGEKGAHVTGHNSTTIGVCYVGGLKLDGKTPADTRTPEQIAAFALLLPVLTGRFPNAKVLGHRDFPGVAKACPSFDARTVYGRAMKRVLALAAAASLSACVTPGAPPPSIVERVAAAYGRIRPVAQALVPLLSPAQAGKVQLALLAGDVALGEARRAPDAVALERALADLTAAVRTIEAARSR